MLPDVLPAAGSESLADRSAPLAERLGEAEFARLHAGIAPRLWGFLCSQTGSPQVADDLAQEAWTRVLASRLAPESDEHFRRYVYRTAVHLLRDRRRIAHREPLPLSEEVEAPAPAPDPGLRHDLERGFSRLPARERRLLWLAHAEGLDHATIGEIVGARAGSVRVMLFRARRKLARLLGHEAARERKEET